MLPCSRASTLKVPNLKTSSERTLFKSPKPIQDSSFPNPQRRILQNQKSVSHPGPPYRNGHNQQNRRRDGKERNLPRNLPQTRQLPNPHALTLLFRPIVLKTSIGVPIPFLTPLFFCSRSSRIKRHFRPGVVFRGIFLGLWLWCCWSQSGLVGGVRMSFVFRRLVAVSQFSIWSWV